MAVVNLDGKQQKLLALANTYLEVWFGEGQAYVALNNAHTGEPILALCDDEVPAAMKRRGILGRSPALWLDRMIVYALNHQLVLGKMWLQWIRKERTQCGGS